MGGGVSRFGNQTYGLSPNFLIRSELMDRCTTDYLLLTWHIRSTRKSFGRCSDLLGELLLRNLNEIR